MRTLLWLPWVVALLLAGCESRRPGAEASESSRAVPVAPRLPADTSSRVRHPLPPALPLDTEMAETWTRLRSALRRHDAATLNQFIDPALGLWVVEEGDAGVVITRVAAGAAFRRACTRVPFQRIEQQLQICSGLLAVAQFPEIDCGDRVNGRSGFESDGCFSGPAADFQTMDLRARTRLKGGTVAQGRAAQRRVARTVLHTRSGFRFHFAKAPGTGGHWYLVFVDLRSPCIS